jgi:hypothetical protein
MNETLICDLSSARARKARFGRHFDNDLLRRLLWVVAIALLGAWGWLVFMQNLQVAHFLCIPVGILATILLWYNGELKNLKPTQSIVGVVDVAQVLDRQILAQLKDDMSPKDIAKIMTDQTGGYFYGSRYAVGPTFIQQLSSENKG